MPEGDTISKLADYLGAALTGRHIISGFVSTTETVNLTGTRIGRVFARGKHLFIELDAHRLLRSHLGMWGSWHVYVPGEAWQKPRRQGSIVLDVGERVFVCFNAAQVEVMRSQGVRRRALDLMLGPDLLADAVAFDEILRRARDLVAGDTPIVDVLLNQRVACGIGNVYKSEVLFLDGCHPKRLLQHLSDERITDMYRLARELLLGNTRGGPRVTRRSNDEASRLWVYDRRGQPCLRCEDVIRSAKLGKDLRPTYWCPGCQAAE